MHFQQLCIEYVRRERRNHWTIINFWRSPKPNAFALLPALIIGGDIVDLVRETGLVAQAVLVVLLAFSVLSWAVILSKWSALRRARVQSGRFLRAFRRAQKLQDIAAVCEQYRPSPLVGVFQAGFREFERQVGTSGAVRNPLAVQRAMQIVVSEQITGFERNLPWLAITAAVTPFIGLFGTVWGIIDAFHGLGTSGAATLRAVAPGISEALDHHCRRPGGRDPGGDCLQPDRQFDSRFCRTLRRLFAGNAECDRAPGSCRAACGGGASVMAFTAANGRTQLSISDINITPLVDVVLVLLIIFMVTAPVLQSGIEVSVPKTRTVKEITEERMVICIDKQQRVFLGNDPVNINEIGTKLRQKVRDPQHQSIFLRADEDVPFGAFATVMDAVKSSGITNVSIVTQPLESNGKH